MTRVRLLALIGVLGAVGGALWFVWPRHENVILITIDTMRPDRISAYGYEKHRTPNLDRLAQEGTLFENAFCDVTWTTPSMASVMTGTYATRHGLRTSFQTLKPEATTLAEILRNNGIATAAIIASFPLHSMFGLGQGFGLYDETFTAPLVLDESIEFGPPEPIKRLDVPPSDDTEAMRWFLKNKQMGDAYRSDAQVSDRAIAWLRQERKEPFFLWIHYFGPHEKPTGLIGFEHWNDERAIQLAAYDPDVVSVDKEIGRVLDTLDAEWLTSRTAVIVHADHGQSLTEHDYFGHGRDIFDATAHIPLIIRAPGLVPAGRRDPVLARNVDLLPTILGLLGILNPTEGDGSDLFARRPADDPAVYLETYLSGTYLFSDAVDDPTIGRMAFRRIGIRTARWKYVINDPIPFLDKPSEPLDSAVRGRFYVEELFDLTTDPGETRNCIMEHPDIATKLRSDVGHYQTLGPTMSQSMQLDDGTREKLKALGYLAE